MKAAWGEEREICCEINVCPSAEALWFAYEDNAYHILLQDVEMGKTYGMELAKQLRAAERQAKIIFVTSHFEFAGEGYEVDALHCLVKQVARHKLFQVLNKAAK